MNKRTPHKGNALLIAILLTGILVLITVSLANLITAETRQLGQMIENGRAQYLAEAGSEAALFLVHQNRPGFEPKINNKPLVISYDESKRYLPEPVEQFSLNIEASEQTLPIVEDYIRELSQGDVTYKSQLFDTLELNESISIPMQPGTTNFEFQYYMPVETDESVRLPEFDVLLWKLFGVNNNTNLTDFMTEYLPAAIPAQREPRTAISPASFGTQGTGQTYNCGIKFEFSEGNEDDDIQPLSPEEVEESVNDPRPCDSVQEFVQNHNNKGLRLFVTNAVNPSMLSRATLAPSITLQEAAIIKYRICTPDCSTIDNPKSSGEENLVPTFTRITSSGRYRDTEKRLRTSVNQEGFLPVFDFAIYRTAN